MAFFTKTNIVPFMLCSLSNHSLRSASRIEESFIVEKIVVHCKQWDCKKSPSRQHQLCQVPSVFRSWGQLWQRRAFLKKNDVLAIGKRKKIWQTISHALIYPVWRWSPWHIPQMSRTFFELSQNVLQGFSYPIWNMIVRNAKRVLAFWYKYRSVLAKQMFRPEEIVDYSPGFKAIITDIRFVRNRSRT